MKNLKEIKMKLEKAMEGEPVNYEIKEVWMDFGAGIRHTTIVAHPENGMSWQIFSPRDLKEIKEGTYTSDSFEEMVERHKKMIR